MSIRFIYRCTRSTCAASTLALATLQRGDIVVLGDADWVAQAPVRCPVCGSSVVPEKHEWSSSPRDQSSPRASSPAREGADAPEAS